MHYKWDDFVTVVFPLGEEKTSGKTTQEKIFSLIRQKPEITRKEIAKIIGLSADGVKYHLDVLRRKRCILHVGPTKKGRWKIIESSNDK